MSAAEKNPTPTVTLPPDARISADDSRRYWQNADADNGGMLGGYPNISRVDLRGTRSFLAKLGLGRTRGRKAVRRALEGGAGIGRITQALLVELAETVDVIEPVARFTEQLKERAGVGEIFNVGLEEWRRADDDEEPYDLIFNQWCLGHLTDAQLEAYLRRCAAALSVGEDGGARGFIVVKENLATGGEDLFDGADSSVTRLDENYRRIFDKAGLRIVKTELQHGFPSELYPVRMFALKPKETA